jgi:hypothetical protein
LILRQEHCSAEELVAQTGAGVASWSELAQHEHSRGALLPLSLLATLMQLHLVRFKLLL